VHGSRASRPGRRGRPFTAEHAGGRALASPASCPGLNDIPATIPGMRQRIAGGCGVMDLVEQTSSVAKVADRSRRERDHRGSRRPVGSTNASPPARNRARAGNELDRRLSNDRGPHADPSPTSSGRPRVADDPSPRSGTSLVAREPVSRAGARGANAASTGRSLREVSDSERRDPPGPMSSLRWDVASEATFVPLYRPCNLAPRGRGRDSRPRGVCCNRPGTGLRLRGGSAFARQGHARSSPDVGVIR